MRSSYSSLSLLLALAVGCQQPVSEGTDVLPGDVDSGDVDSGGDDSGDTGSQDTGDSGDTGSEDTGDSGDTDTAEVGSAPATVAELFALLGPASVSFTIDDAAIGGSVEGESVSIGIGPDAFFFSDGSLASGAVDLSLTEFDSLGDMVRGGRATMTTSGQWLETSGSFVLEASQEGVPLTVNGITDIAFDAWDPDADGMELWVAGDAGEAWARPLERPTQPKGGADGSGSMSEFLFNGVWAGGIGGYSAYNCDAITSLSPTGVSLDVKFLSHFSEEAAVFFIPDGAASAVQLYTGDLSLPGYRSYNNGMPVGITGKLVVYSLIDGSYFLFHDDAYTIPPGVDTGGGLMLETLEVDLVETSEADFNAYLNGL